MSIYKTKFVIYLYFDIGDMINYCIYTGCKTSLYIASEKNHVEIVSMLLKKENIDVNIQDKVCNIFVCWYCTTCCL